MTSPARFRAPDQNATITVVVDRTMNYSIYLEAIDTV